MQPISSGKQGGNKPNTCGTRRTRSTGGLHPEAQPEATCKSLGTHSIMQRAPVHLPCAGVPSPACHAAPRALTVAAAPEVPAVAVAGVVVVAAAAAAAAALGATVEDMLVAAGTQGAWCGAMKSGERLVYVGVGPIGEARGARRHRFRIRVHRLVLVPRLMHILRMLLRPLLSACLQNM